MEDDLVVTRSLTIAGRELRMRATGSGGPGGQHANTANTKVELTFNVVKSRSLGPIQRRRVVDKLGEIIIVTASDRRSQSQNRELARQRLAARLARALKVEKPRTATKASRSQREKRLQEKQIRSRTKQTRRRPDESD